MSRNERDKIIKLRRLALLLGIIIVVFLGFSLRAKYLSSSFDKSTLMSVADRDETVTVLKSPIIDNIDSSIEKIEEEEKKQELEKLREEIRVQKEIERKKKEEEFLTADKRKIAYLTFDDGPSKKSTPAILDILKAHDVKATFFILGRMADTNPEILQRVHREGHAIGHHSYGHDYKYLYSSPDNFMADINKTAQAFKRILGEDFETDLLRFPGGEFGKKKNQYADIARGYGYKSFNWNALNGDAEGHNLSAAHLLNRLKSTVGGQRKVVILMHDTDAKRTTVDSLSDSIQYLKDNGYEFKTLYEYLE